MSEREREKYRKRERERERKRCSEGSGMDGKRESEREIEGWREIYI